jgi:hypothetical protein
MKILSNKKYKELKNYRNFVEKHYDIETSTWHFDESYIEGAYNPEIGGWDISIGKI